MSDARHEKFMADCAAQVATLERLQASLHAKLPQHVREHGVSALPDAGWDDFIAGHPELTADA